MVYKTDISIALKNFNGQYDMVKFSLFEMNNINKYFTSFNMKVNNKLVILKVKCSLCEKYHYYSYSINELLTRKLTIGGCEVLGLPLFYIGNYIEVEKKIKKYNNDNKKIRAMI